MNNPFHLAFRVNDLASTRKFYGEILGCLEGRSTDTWVDFNFFGNQISAHLGKSEIELDYCGKIDGVSVPVPHFGCLLQKDQFNAIRQRFESADIDFVIKPYQRFKNLAYQQEAMYVLDYSFNPLEFKAFKDQASIYKR